MKTVKWQQSLDFEDGGRLPFKKCKWYNRSSKKLGNIVSSEYKPGGTLISVPLVLRSVRKQNCVVLGLPAGVISHSSIETQVVETCSSLIHTLAWVPRILLPVLPHPLLLNLLFSPFTLPRDLQYTISNNTKKGWVASKSMSPSRISSLMPKLMYFPGTWT